MTTFGTLQPKIDDIVEVYLNKAGHCSPTKCTTLIRGTVIGVYHPVSKNSWSWLVGWKLGETAPVITHTISSIMTYAKNHTGCSFAPDALNYDKTLWLSYGWECEPVSALQAASNAQASMIGAGKTYSVQQNNLQTTLAMGKQMKYDAAEFIRFDAAAMQKHALKEKPCRNSTCGRMNDIGVKKCWNCECENP